jgi:MFS family permease
MKKSLYGYVVWFVATLYVVYAFCLNTAAAVFTDAIEVSLHTSHMGAAIATGAFILGFACMQIPAGYLLDKFNIKYVVSAGVLLLASGNLIISYAASLQMFAISNFMQGLGGAFAFIGTAVLTAQWFSARLFPIMLGLTQTLACIFAGVIHYYYTLALKTHVWNEVYFDTALFGFVLFALVFLCVRAPSGFQREPRISLRSSLALVLTNKQIWLCSLAGAISFGTVLAYAGLWFVKVQKLYHIDSLHAVMISALVFAGIGIGTPALGWLSDVVKSRKSVINSSLLLGALSLVLLIYLPLYNVDSLLTFKIFSFLMGFLLSGSMLFYTMISEIATDSTRGVAMSVLNTSVFLFNTLLLFIPYFFETYVSANYFTYLWILPFCVMMSVVLLYFIRDTYSTK